MFFSFSELDPFWTPFGPSASGVPSGEFKIQRFVDLLFGHPFHTSQPDEYAMYQAAAVALRSSDDNRQVGAVIVSLTRGPNEIKNADVIAVGMNEVPRGGGGFYWDENSPDSSRGSSGAGHELRCSRREQFRLTGTKQSLPFGCTGDILNVGSIAIGQLPLFYQVVSVAAWTFDV
jgi:hypothetical protein